MGIQRVSVLVAVVVSFVLVIACIPTSAPPTPLPGGQTLIVATPTPTPTSVPVATPVPPSPTPPEPSPTPCLPEATFVQDVTVPDGTQFLPGNIFTKVWRIRSSGCAPWPEGVRLAFVSGDQMGAPPNVPVPQTALGSSADCSVLMQAPNAPGTYRGVWQMETPNGIRFGDRVFVEIVVIAPSATPLPLGVTFVADRYTIRAGECTTVSWLVGNARAVRYNGQDVGFMEARLECPPFTTVFELAVQRLDGGWETYSLFITVEPAAY